VIGQIKTMATILTFKFDTCGYLGGSNKIPSVYQISKKNKIKKNFHYRVSAKKYSL